MLVIPPAWFAELPALGAELLAATQWVDAALARG